MLQAARQRFTFAEYVRLEEHGSTKHEFLAGEVWAMAGGSPTHAALAANLIAALTNGLAGRPCRVYTSDLRIRAPSGLATYPDVTVICGRVETDPEDPTAHTVTNPAALFEVLSSSTEAYDRGEKLAQYKAIASVHTIGLVAHDAQRVEVWTRAESDGRWELAIHQAGQASETAERPRLGMKVEVTAIYRDLLGSD